MLEPAGCLWEIQGQTTGTHAEDQRGWLAALIPQVRRDQLLCVSRGKICPGARPTWLVGEANLGPAGRDAAVLTGGHDLSIVRQSLVTRSGVSGVSANDSAARRKRLILFRFSIN